MQLIELETHTLAGLEPFKNGLDVARRFVGGLRAFEVGSSAVNIADSCSMSALTYCCYFLVELPVSILEV